jgi:hypothetical protein
VQGGNEYLAPRALNPAGMDPRRETPPRPLGQGGSVLPVVAGIVRVFGVIVQGAAHRCATACGRPGPSRRRPVVGHDQPAGGGLGTDPGQATCSAGG